MFKVKIERPLKAKIGIPVKISVTFQIQRKKQVQVRFTWISEARAKH
jgi:hypothetical protein